MAKKAIEVRQKGEPDKLNRTPYYSPVGRLPSGKLSYAFGGSLLYARRKARQMEREGRYVEVWIEAGWSSGISM